TGCLGRAPEAERPGNPLGPAGGKSGAPPRPPPPKIAPGPANSPGGGAPRQRGAMKTPGGPPLGVPPRRPSAASRHSLAHEDEGHPIVLNVRSASRRRGRDGRDGFEPIGIERERPAGWARSRSPRSLPRPGAAGLDHTGTS